MNEAQMRGMREAHTALASDERPVERCSNCLHWAACGRVERAMNKGCALHVDEERSAAVAGVKCPACGGVAIGLFANEVCRCFDCDHEGTLSAYQGCKEAADKRETAGGEYTRVQASPHEGEDGVLFTLEIYQPGRVIHLEIAKGTTLDAACIKARDLAYWIAKNTEENVGLLRGPEEDGPHADCSQGKTKPDYLRTALHAGRRNY